MKIFNYLLVLFLMAGCTNGQRMNETINLSSDNETKAVATLMSLGGNNVSGTITFEEAEEGVRVSGTINGLESTAHGFHVHQYGDCSAADGSSAGGHYNPDDNEHGAPDSDNRHMGDMGNIEVTGGSASVDYADAVLDLNQIIGRAVIVHAGEDDLTSQPTGDAGGRIACGVIGIAQSQADTE